MAATTETEPPAIDAAEQERLRRHCRDKGADYGVALWIVLKAYQEFPDPDKRKFIDGADRDRVNYGRSLANRTQYGWSLGLEPAVWDFLLGY